MKIEKMLWEKHKSEFRIHINDVWPAFMSWHVFTKNA